MEEVKQGWKKRLSWLIIAIIVVMVYKLLDNFSNVQQWFFTFFGILMPFLIGLLIAYILFIPCAKIEKIYKSSRFKIVRKKARVLSVFTTYVIAILLIVVLINCIIPVLKDSLIELFSNLQNYYEIVINKFNELPEDSIFKSDIIRQKITEIQSIDIQKLFDVNSEKIFGYIRNILNAFTGLFDVFVSIVVSVYVLVQRTTIVNFLRRLSRAMFKKETYETVDKYFTRANEIFFTFISSQLLDAIVVGILTTIAMMILGVRYAPLLGFMIGLFNMIPYIGAIVAVIIAIIITLITGGVGKTIAMSIVVIILQQIDANIINPKIVGHSLQITPLIVLVAVTVGGAYFGIIGMFLGVPVAVVIKEILCDYVNYKNKLRDEEENKTIDSE